MLENWIKMVKWDDKYAHETLIRLYGNRAAGVGTENPSHGGCASFRYGFLLPALKHINFFLVKVKLIAFGHLNIFGGGRV